MDNIKILEQIGLQKVSQETHIEQKYLKFMVDCDFVKLNHINTLGFVKILTKAYNIDLSAWVEAFEEYWAQEHKNDKNQGLFIVVEDEQKSKKLLVFSIIIALIAVLCFLFFIFQDKINLDHYLNHDDTSFEESSIVEDAQKSLNELNNSNLNENNISMFNADENQSFIAPIEMNTTVVNDVEKMKVVPKKEIAKVVKKKTETTVTQVVEKIKPKTTVSTLSTTNTIVIQPNVNLWMGIIYLDNNKRKSYLGKKDIVIDVSRDQIITTGHGNINLIKNKVIEKLHSKTPLKFLVKDGHIKQISISEFNKLNKGKSW